MVWDVWFCCLIVVTVVLLLVVLIVLVTLILCLVYLIGDLGGLLLRFAVIVLHFELRYGDSVCIGTGALWLGLMLFGLFFLLRHFLLWFVS